MFEFELYFVAKEVDLQVDLSVRNDFMHFLSALLARHGHSPPIIPPAMGGIYRIARAAALSLESHDVSQKQPAK